jgi:putative nucleotidyltransferase with HDIG domain
MSQPAVPEDSVTFDSQVLNDFVALLYNIYEHLSPALLEHSRELARLCDRLARALAWPEPEIKKAFIGALFHDIGHLLSPAGIRDYSEDKEVSEVDMDREHPLLGVQILRRVKCLQPIVPAVRSHHERYDGGGFPDGLKGEQIPPLARLVSVAHLYLLLCQGVGSTEPMAESEAREVIGQEGGHSLDPEMVKVFLESLPAAGQAEPESSAN